MIIEMFPAKNGDAFLIRLDNKKNILIDMGYMDTYKTHIKDRLKKIKSENKKQSVGGLNQGRGLRSPQRNRVDARTAQGRCCRQTECPHGALEKCLSRSSRSS